MPNIPNNLLGHTFNRLTVIERGRSDKNGIWWKCRCVCGRVISARAFRLRTGRTKSCGCWRRETFRARLSTHGKTYTREYIAWRNAKARCTNPRHPNWSNYGGRGIRMCAEWLTDFPAFLSHSGPCPSGGSIDRIDNERGYEPGNIRWITQHEQTRNTRQNRPLTFNGRTMVIADWASVLGINEQALHKRLFRLGWSITHAFTTPSHTVQPFAKYVTFNGQRQPIAAWARHYGIRPHTLAYRLRKGWSVERALTTPVK